MRKWQQIRYEQYLHYLSTPNVISVLTSKNQNAFRLLNANALTIILILLLSFWYFCESSIEYSNFKNVFLKRSPSIRSGFSIKLSFLFLCYFDLLYLFLVFLPNSNLPKLLLTNLYHPNLFLLFLPNLLIPNLFLLNPYL